MIIVNYMKFQGRIRKNSRVRHLGGKTTLKKRSSPAEFRNRLKNRDETFSSASIFVFGVKVGGGCHSKSLKDEKEGKKERAGDEVHKGGSLCTLFSLNSSRHLGDALVRFSESSAGPASVLAIHL